MNDRVTRWRQDTPGCTGRIHLNNSGAGLMPRPVIEALTQHIQREALIGGYEAADEAADAVAATYQAIADLLNTQPRNVALTENATTAFAQAMSAFDFQPGDVIVTTPNDYVSNQLLFLALAQRHGVVIRRAEDLPEGGVDPASIAQLVRDPRCRLVTVTWVPTNSGLVQPVRAVGEVCREAGIPYLVDACQAVGQISVDVTQLKCDFLSATARKFLRGPRGIGFLFVSDAALERGSYPLFIDMRGARWLEASRFEPVADARRFENWEFPYALVLGLGEAARYAQTVGVEAAGSIARALAALTRERLAAVPGVRVLDRGAEQCAIVTAEIAGHPGRKVVQALRELNINVSAIEREFAVIDMDQKRAKSGIRISPHYYNTPDEIDRFVLALGRLS